MNMLYLLTHLNWEEKKCSILSRSVEVPLARCTHRPLLRLSRFKLAEPPMPRDTESSNAYAVIHDSLGPVCICRLIGINSTGREHGRLCVGAPGKLRTVFSLL